LKRRITFDEIPLIIERVLEQVIPEPRNVEEIKEIYRLGMKTAEALITERSISG